MKLQVGYVGSQGHRLLATHDINYGNPQTCLDINDALGAGTCGPYSADSSFFIPAGTVTGRTGCMVPYGPNGPTLVPANTPTPSDITLVGLRRYSSPNCDPFSGTGCPQDGIPVFSSIFAQDTIANSAYNSLQASLDKRFSHGLQFTAAYTFSKSFDEASSFEGILNPIDPQSQPFALRLRRAPPDRVQLLLGVAVPPTQRRYGQAAQRLGSIRHNHLSDRIPHPHHFIGRQRVDVQLRFRTAGRARADRSLSHTETAKERQLLLRSQ